MKQYEFGYEKYLLSPNKVPTILCIGCETIITKNINRLLIY